MNSLPKSAASSSPSVRASFYCRFGKRWLDATCALCGLLLLAPVFLVIAIVVRLSSPGAVFFTQQRTGRFGNPFNMFKFRTMLRHAESTGPLLTAEGDPRITLIGKWLRKTKLDELPQLINVLRGDMSFVGPRPEVPRYARLYDECYKAIFQERPGITGPSINVQEEAILARQTDREAFYISTILPAKLKVDLHYCQNIRFWDDVKLLFSTPMKIVVGFATLSDPYANASESNR